MKRNLNDDSFSDESDYSSKSSGRENSFSAIDYSHNSSENIQRQASLQLNSQVINRNNIRNNISKLSEDEEKKKLRRERNKMAAAKCRQKRVDQTNQLLEETQKLEEEQKSLKEEIKSFERQKEELQMIMESHLQHCKINSKVANSIPTTNGTTNIKEDINRVKLESVANSNNEFNSTPLYLKSENGKPFLVSQQQQLQQLHQAQLLFLKNHQSSNQSFNNVELLPSNNNLSTTFVTSIENTTLTPLSNNSKNTPQSLDSFSSQFSSTSSIPSLKQNNPNVSNHQINKSAKPTPPSSLPITFSSLEHQLTGVTPSVEISSATQQNLTTPVFQLPPSITPSSTSSMSSSLSLLNYSTSKVPTSNCLT